ncbi:M4 family metallopeptidase [Bailinhaonella thermotolerans]|uniref:M4 family metallopeptidase n=1 Tax=Bailinhaonella thermotolerans TaxID=1070861 RepID=UPI001F5B59CE|nr:M4 family metallopeptidase [Bailinhaonella thermotolerans]
MRPTPKFAGLALAAGLAVALAVTPAGVASAQGRTQHAPQQADPKAQAAAAADRLIAANPGVFHKSAKDTMERQAVTEGGGLYYVSYERKYAGIPVEGGDFVIVVDGAGKVLSTSVAQTEALNVPTTPKLSADQADEKARGRAAAGIRDTSEPRLTVLAKGDGVLTYETVVEGERNGRPYKLHVYVDAQTGEVVETWDEVREGQGNSYYHGPVTIATTQSGTQYTMADPGRPGIRCGGQDGGTYSGPDDNWGNGTGTNLETACVDALYAVQKQWDMLGSWLGRNGINGQGGGFPARVGLAQANAYWNGSFTNFGRSQDGQRQATPTDVVAHEYGHAIFQTTPGGSTGSNETGGLNESTGDIFGALTEWYLNEPRRPEPPNLDPPDYDVGEEVNLVGRGPIRYMNQPSRISGHPDCFSSSVPGMEVHAAAGVQNHWFYLLSEGSNANDPGNGRPNSPTCNGSTVTGIGIQKAGKIFMGALNRKVSYWTHSLSRKASLEAAIQLFPGSCAEFEATRAAWNAVSVPAASGEPTTCQGGGDTFDMTINPASASITPGQSATSTITTRTTGGNAQTVTFRVSGLPAGATATFNPPSVTSGGTSTMTIATSATTPEGSHQVTITGDGTAQDKTAVFTLNVGTTGGPVFSDDFETDKGWTAGGTATSGRFERGNPQPTSYSGTALQPDTTPSGVNAVVTGAAAGASAGDYDLDGGVTTMQSPAIALPSGANLTLSFSWYLAHLNNASNTDYLRVKVVSATTGTVFEQLGAATNRAGTWNTATVNLSSYAGQSVRILIEAADAGTASLVEAGVDNISITRS